MTREPFNTGWTYRRPLGPFAACRGRRRPTPVTLPHDALRDAERAADVPCKGAGAYYPPGAYAYLKTFDVPADWADASCRWSSRALSGTRWSSSMTSSRATGPTATRDSS